MLDVRRMKVLREVAAHGSFSAAAEALNFTQSAVSQHVAALERETGTQLVERLPRGVRLTEAGSVLVGHADAIIARLESAEEDLAAIAGLRGGRLRLVCFQSAGATVLPRAEHPLAGRRRLSLKDLADESWIVSTPNNGCRTITSATCRAAGFEPRVAFEADDTLASQALVAGNVGVTMMPRMALTGLHPGAVARALSDAPRRRVLAARMQGAFHSPASDAMLSILQDAAAGFTGPRLELAAS